MATTIEAIIPSLLQEHARLFVGYPIVFDDDVLEAPEDAYIQGNYLPNVVDNLFIGNEATVRYQGLFQLTVVARPGDGFIRAADIAGGLVNHFPKGLALRENPVTVKVYAKPSVAAPITVNFQLRIPVTIPWRSFN